MTELSDQQARDLIAAGTAETLFVEAGAGTGKTTALVSRILALVAEGVRMESIAAITFTEKAAAELAERVREKLEAAVKTEPEPGRRGRFAQAVDELDQASIQTLHSFAMRILGLFPLEAGLPPRLTLRDDVEAHLVFREHWDRFLDRLLDDERFERPLLRGLTTGLRLTDLAQVAQIFNENWDRLEGLSLPTAEEPHLDPEAVLDPLEQVMAMRRPGAEDSLTRKLDSLWGLIEILGELKASFGGPDRSRAEVDLLRALARTPELTKSLSGRAPNLGNKNYWPDIDAARECIREAEAARRGMVDGTRSAVLCTLLPGLRDFIIETAGERRQEGELEFHDLLVLSRDLLRNNPVARATLRNRFSRILIDEFQDTDPLQVELAALLAGSGSQPQNWAATSAEPGRLFFVGDPKQSIYRFRRADIELFKRARGSFGARHVPLTRNFRCRPGILEWVNAVCGELFTGFGGMPDERQADWIPLAAARETGKGPAVHVIGGPRKAYAAAIRQDEADAVAATVLAARQENWLARDLPRGTTTRSADIAILLPTRTNSPAIERALASAGIPTRIESRSLLFSAQEIRDLTNILAAIDDPTDDVAVVAALRSPAFAVDDGGLLEHSLAGGNWDYTRPFPAASPQPVVEGMAALKQLHDARWGSSIGALVERVIAERRMLELGVAGARPREAWRRLRFVAEQARSLGDSGTVTSLRQFVHWLRTQAEEGARIAESVANEPDDDAVRILTIHAAKGLEFPIVILAGLGIEPLGLPPRVAWRQAGGVEEVAVHIGRMGSYFDTPNFDAMRENERAHEWAERDRLFYVAATRAKERLVVSLFHKEPTTPHEARHARRQCSIGECLQALRGRSASWPELQHGMALGPGETLEVPAEETEADRAAWIAERAALLDRLGAAPVRAATSIAHDGPDSEDEDEEPRDAEPWKKGRAGTSVGRAVHAVLQTIDLATGASVPETARSQAVAEGIADEADHIARLVESARASAVVREAVASRKFWREVYVGASVEGILVEGFIDLLVEGADGLVVVDYKTDSARNLAEIEASMNKYRLQGAAYALALERAVERPVSKVVFVFAEPKHEYTLPDLESAKRDVLAILGKPATPAAG